MRKQEGRSTPARRGLPRSRSWRLHGLRGAPLGVVLALLIVGCASSAPPPAPGPSAAEIRAQNRAQLSRLSMTMTGEQVLSVMGTRVVQTYEYEEGCPEGYAKGPLIPNPYRSEATRAADGSDLEVLYYYTDWRRGDHEITDDELTPLVLVNGRLAGWGWPNLWQRFDRGPDGARSYLWSYQCDLFRKCPRGRH